MARTAEIERHLQALTGPDRTTTHLVSGPELAEHLRVPRAAAYRAMAADLGVDPDIVPDDDATPALLFAEQPGCWLTARDRIRVRLLHDLVDRGWFDAARSGVFTLANDRFTGDGDKGVYLAFELGAGLGAVRVLGSTFIRRHSRRTYAALGLEGPALERLATILDVSRSILQASREEEDAFITQMQVLRSAGIPDGLEPIYPDDDRPDRLAGLRRRLEPFDTTAAARLLDLAAAKLEADTSWMTFWNETNAAFLETPVRRLGPHISRLVLAIRDPERTGRALADLMDRGTGEPVGVAGVAFEDGVHRMVWYDPTGSAFFLLDGDARQPVSWDSIRDMAASGGAVGPCGVLLYLLLAATGHYLIVDPGDGFHPFHARACAMHALYTGRRFPWITFDGPLEGDAAANAFLDAYHAGFEARTRAILNRFRAG